MQLGKFRPFPRSSTYEHRNDLVMHRKAGEQVEITYFRKGEKRRVVAVLMPRERM